MKIVESLVEKYIKKGCIWEIMNLKRASAYGLISQSHPAIQCLYDNRIGVV